MIAGVSEVLRDRMREWCCATLAAVSAEGETLCEGWDAHDLAVHLWTLNHDPASWAGIALPPLRGWTDRRGAAIRVRWSYLDLVDRLRDGPASFACMPGDRREHFRHALGEWFMHGLDVARPHGLPEPELDPDLAEALWTRCRRAAGQLNLLRPGLVLELPDGRSARISPGRERVRVAGPITELLLWTYGRRGARVEVARG